MPIYEYHCESCDSHFEVLQRVSAKDKDLRCPHCGDAKVEKQFSTFAAAGGNNSLNATGKSSRSSCGSGGFS